MASRPPTSGAARCCAGFLIAALTLSGAAGRFGALLACAAGLWLIGTLDDRIARLAGVAAARRAGDRRGPVRERSRLVDLPLRPREPRADCGLDRGARQRVQPDGQPRRCAQRGRRRVVRGDRRARARRRGWRSGRGRPGARRRTDGLSSLQSRRSGADLPRRRRQHADRPPPRRPRSRGRQSPRTRRSGAPRGGAAGRAADPRHDARERLAPAPGHLAAPGRPRPSDAPAADACSAPRAAWRSSSPACRRSSARSRSARTRWERSRSPRPGSAPRGFGVVAITVLDGSRWGPPVRPSAPVERPQTDAV